MIGRVPQRLRRLTVASVAALVGFVAGWAVFSPDTSTPGEITVSAAHVAAHAANRSALLGRALTWAEIEAIIDRQIAIEVTLAEADRLQIHLKSPDIRKHLVAAMDPVLSARVPEPTQEALDVLYAESPERFMTPPSVSFEHVFFAREENRAAALAEAAAAGAPVPEAAGDRFWLGRRMERYYYGQLLTVLGHEFTAALKGLPEGVWSGPVKSARGWHVVRLDRRHPPAPLEPEELDRRLRQAWAKREAVRAYDAEISRLAAGHVIRRPSEAEIEAAMAAQREADRLRAEQVASVAD